MVDLLTPDLCIIGAGAAGLSVAAAAAALGLKVVLVERAAMGGECLNSGCIPSKALIAVANAAFAARAAGPLGLGDAIHALDFSLLRRRVGAIQSGIAANDSVERFRALNCMVLQARARFLDPQTVEADGNLIRARRFIVATGSAPAIPPIAGLAATRFFTNETIFGIDELPAHLVVIGAGAVGLELGQAFRRLGSKVTILDQLDALRSEDRDLAGVVLARLGREGIHIREGVGIESAEVAGTGVRLVLRGAAGETVDATHLLVATGRAPCVEGIGLDAAGVAHGKDGIAVGRDLRTSNRRVFALGDVLGGGSTSLANHQASLIVRRVVFRMPVRLRPELAPRALYTSPELASVGLGEADARARRGGKVGVLRAAFADNDRARTSGSTEGFVKIVVDRRGRILGASVVGDAASELIAPLALAMRKNMRVHDLRDMALSYPTRAEAIKRAALGYFLPELAKPRLARFVRFLNSWG